MLFSKVSEMGTGMPCRILCLGLALTVTSTRAAAATPVLGQQSRLLRLCQDPSLLLTSAPIVIIMGDHILLDLNEWALILNKMLRYHYNISEEIKTVVQSIRTEMRPELIPLAEEKANFGKEVKTAVREMWGLEYEVDGLQSQFSESIGAMDLDNMDVDFIEDMMLKSKPLQSVLNDIRNRQMAKLEDIKTKYGPAIMDLEIMVVPRPAKRPDEADSEPEKVEAAAAAAAGEAAPAEAAAGEAAPPAAEAEAPAEAPAAEAEPTPA